MPKGNKNLKLDLRVLAQVEMISNLSQSMISRFDGETNESPFRIKRTLKFVQRLNSKLEASWNATVCAVATLDYWKID